MTFKCNAWCRNLKQYQKHKTGFSLESRHVLRRRKHASKARGDSADRQEQSSQIGLVALSRGCFAFVYPGADCPMRIVPFDVLAVQHWLLSRQLRGKDYQRNPLMALLVFE